LTSSKKRENTEPPAPTEPHQFKQSHTFGQCPQTLKRRERKKKKAPERILEEEQKKKKRKLTHLKSVPPHTGQTLIMKKRINPSVVGDP